MDFTATTITPRKWFSKTIYDTIHSMSGQPYCEMLWLGRQDYTKVWQLQEELAVKIAAGASPPTLLLLEHPPIFTIGRRGGVDHLVWDQAECQARGVQVLDVDRGGDVTYHGPGQLVGYPLLPLAKPGWNSERLPQADFVGYVRNLEKAVIFTLARFGIPSAQRVGMTGVWVMAEAYGRCQRCDPRLRPEPGKIASIGVKVDSHGVSRHGFALNVDPDMAYWDGIIACGLDGVQMLSMADLMDPVPSMQGVADVLAESFAEVFQFDVHKGSTFQGVALS